MADLRAGDTVSTSGRFSDGNPDVEHGHLYESANAGSDRRDFSVARLIDVIAVVMVYVPFPRGGTDVPITASMSALVRAANVNEDNGAVLARVVPGPSEGCRAAIISRICVVIADTELCSARTTSASGSTLLMEAILGWGKSHSVIVALFGLA